MKFKSLTIGLLFGFSVTKFLLKFISLYLKKRKYRHIPGPETNGIIEYFFGNISTFKQEGKILGDILVECHKKYGQVFKLQINDQILIFTSNREAIKQCLVIKNYPKIESISSYPLGERFLGRGLVTELDNNKWKYRRAVFNPGFHRNLLMSFVKQFNDKTDFLLEKLKPLADGKTLITLFPELNYLTLDAIASIAFDMDLDCKKDKQFNEYITDIMIKLNKYLLFPNELLKPNHYISEKNKLKKMIQYLRNVGREKLYERLEIFRNLDPLPNDILTAILSNMKENKIDIELMVDDFMTFFIAGQETTANSLAFCFKELANNPDIVKKLRKEIDMVLGERNHIKYEDLYELKYCNAVFKETLRLWPPVQRLNRICLDEISIDQFKIPANTVISFSTYSMARDETFFDKPYQFIPERFLKQQTEDSQIQNYTYFPFSLGPRNCIGQNFAKIEGIIVIAKLIQRYDFRLEEKHSKEIQEALTLRPKDGTKCYINQRS